MAVSACTWRGDRALKVVYGGLEMVVTECGGQLASLRGRDGGPEALWQPPWTAARPQDADPSWWPAAEAPLLSNICGWNVCLDRFGMRDDDGGRPLHGESNVLPWQLSADDESITATCQLPIAQLAVTRRYALAGQTVVMDCTVTSLDGCDHEIEWCEHISLGDPLMDGAQVTVAATQAVLHPDPGAHAACRFTEPPGTAVDCAAAVAMPTAGDPPAGDIIALPLDAGSWQVVNADLGWSMQASFDHRLLPWLCVWTENRGRTNIPWAGITRVRGMECASKPFPEGLPPASRYPTFLDRPTRLLLPAAGGLSSQVTLTWAPLAE